jgi:hypothetical protein
MLESRPVPKNFVSVKNVAWDSLVRSQFAANAMWTDQRQRRGEGLGAGRSATLMRRRMSPAYRQVKGMVRVRTIQLVLPEFARLLVETDAPRGVVHQDSLHSFISPQEHSLTCSKTRH